MIPTPTVWPARLARAFLKPYLLRVKSACAAKRSMGASRLAERREMGMLSGGGTWSGLATVAAARERRGRRECGSMVGWRRQRKDALGAVRPRRYREGYSERSRQRQGMRVSKRKAVAPGSCGVTLERTRAAGRQNQAEGAEQAGPQRGRAPRIASSTDAGCAFSHTRPPRQSSLDTRHLHHPRLIGLCPQKPPFSPRWPLFLYLRPVHCPLPPPAGQSTALLPSRNQRVHSP